MFWENFVRLCRQRGIAPAQLVQKLNIALGSITKWKNGAVPQSKNLKLIADYFGVSVDELLGQTDDATLHDEKTAPPDSPRERLKQLMEKMSDEDLDKLEKIIDLLLQEK